MIKPKQLFLNTNFYKGFKNVNCLFAPKGHLISGDSVERQFYPDVYVSPTL